MSNLDNFISQKPQVSLLDSLFSKQLPRVCSEPLLSIDTKSDPAITMSTSIIFRSEVATPYIMIWEIHLPLVHLIVVVSRQHVSLFIKFYLHVYKSRINESALWREIFVINRCCAFVTECVAVRRQDFGSKVRTSSEQTDQPRFDGVVQMYVHRRLQGLSRHQERLDTVLRKQFETLITKN